MVLQSGVMHYRENEQDTWHPLIIKAQSVDLMSLVDSYDPVETRTWAEGEYCLYNDTIYRCISATSTPAAFDPQDWVQTYLSDEIERLGVSVQATEPATSKVWIDTDETTSVTCPDITEFNNLADSLGIVVNGSTARAGCTATGQYIILQNSTIADHADGLYTAAKTFSAGSTLDGTYLNENGPKTTVGGAVNDLKNTLNQLADDLDTAETDIDNLDARLSAFEVATKTKLVDSSVAISGNTQWQPSATGTISSDYKKYFCRCGSHGALYNSFILNKEDIICMGSVENEIYTYWDNGNLGDFKIKYDNNSISYIVNAKTNDYAYDYFIYGLN